MTTAAGALRERLRGPMIGEADAGYDAARAVWNRDGPVRPATPACR